MANSYNGGPLPHQKSFEKNSSASYASVKTVGSTEMSINSLPPENNCQMKWPSSPVPSYVSLKSDRSMKIPIHFKGKPSVPEESFQLKRSNSSTPSLMSLKSDRSMKIPIHYKEKPPLPEKSFQVNGSNSSTPSLLSLKSDKSMKLPIHYKEKPPLPEKSFQLKRSNSSSPSLMSLKSDRSMKIPIHYKENPSPTDKSNTQRQLWTSSPRGLMRNGVTVSVNSGEALSVSDISELTTEKLKNILRERYQHLFEGTTQRENPLPLNTIYTELFITESIIEDLKYHHEINQIHAAVKIGTADTVIKCSDIFTRLPGQDKSVKTVLTKGVAGIGKTVSVQKFVLDWAEGKANQDIHFIFPLPFREINLMRDQKQSLNDLLQHFFMKRIDASSPQMTNLSLVFIFDGLDECRLPLDFQNNETFWDATKETSVDILLTNLIKGNLLPSARIWITSRPAASDRIPTEFVDRVTEVRGFSEPQKEEYFRKKICDHSLATRIVTHLKSLRSLYVMCHIPVFCWIAATVLERMVVDCGWDKIPKSLTQMYTHFLILQICMKKAKYSENKTTDNEMIFKLGKLAFEQLEKGNLIFYEEDLRECGIDVREASVYSGVFTQIFREEFGLFQRKVFSFVHLSIQEHLAALYVFLSFHNNKQNVLDPQPAKQPVTMLSLHQKAIDKASESYSGHLDLFLRFLLGFSLESNQVLLQDLLVQRSSGPVEIKETVEYLKAKIRESVCASFSVRYFHCLNEINDRSLVEEIQTFLKNNSHNEENLSTELWAALVFVILTSDENLDEFELHKYGTSDRALCCLLSVVKLCKKARIDNCNITVRGCTVLAAALIFNPLMRELDLSHSKVQDAGIKMLCTGFQDSTLKKQLAECSEMTKTNSQLATVLCLKSSCKTNQELVWDEVSQTIYQFLKALHENFKLNELPGLQGMPCNIEILRLRNCGVTSVGCGSLASVLSSKSSVLRELDLSQNSVGDSGVKVLSDAIMRSSCKLDTLKMNSCDVTELSCAALASALQASSGLKTVSLCDNELRDSGVKLLATGLGSPHCKLETLSLTNCQIKFEGFASLASALRSNPSHLRVLDLNKNRPDLGVKLLSGVLETTHCRLEILNLIECGITEKNCSALASVLSSESSCLKELDLSINDLKDSGVKLLSVGLRSPHCKLHKLKFYKCNVTEEGFATLAEALQSNPSLQKECCLMDQESEEVLFDTG